MRFISFTTDFGAGSRANGTLIGVGLKICHDAIIEHFADVNSFDIKGGARLLEGIIYLPPGCHVCVVDPGVGTGRKAIIIETKRGDYLIGPDNGVLIPACEFLGGIKKIVEITNEEYMLKPVSSIFHGRDIFMPAAAHLANGVSMKKFGDELKASELIPAPYKNAEIKNEKIECEVIHINKFGSAFLNVLAGTMEKIFRINDKCELRTKDKRIMLPYKKTFADVAIGKPVIMNDDFGRVEMAINQGSFSNKFKIVVGDRINLCKSM